MPRCEPATSCGSKSDLSRPTLNSANGLTIDLLELEGVRKVKIQKIYIRFFISFSNFFIAARRGKRSYRPDRAGGDQGSGRRNKRGSGGQRRTGGRGPFRGRKRMPRRRGNKNGEVDTAAAGDGAQKTELAVE